MKTEPPINSAAPGQPLPWVKLPAFLALGSLLFTFFSAPLRQSPWLANAGIFVFALVAFYFLLQALQRYRDRQWNAGLWATLRLVLCSIILAPVALLLALATLLGPASEGFATNLAFPQNIEIFEPEPSELSPADKSKDTTLLHLSQGFQPGIYAVQTWLSLAERGTVTLRAYEATRNTRLSSQTLTPTSKQHILASAQPIFYNHDITIFEGDWGQPYAARFELWFKPASSGPERKLIERTFKIEGWQR